MKTRRPHLARIDSSMDVSSRPARSSTSFGTPTRGEFATSALGSQPSSPRVERTPPRLTAGQ